MGTALANQTLKTLFARARPCWPNREQLQLPQRTQLGVLRLFLTLGVLASRQQPPRWRLTWVLLAVIRR